MQKEPIRFTVDGMLGNLAKYIRALGFDTYFEALPWEQLLQRCSKEKRILVTLRRTPPENAECRIITVLGGSIETQLKEVFETLSVIPRRDGVLTICLECNTPTIEVEPHIVKNDIPESVEKTISSFRRCPSCRRVYWWGSHADRIMERLERSGIFEPDR